MTAAARRHDQPEPNTLPRGIGLLNLAFFCLLLSDLGTAGALLAQLSVADDEARTLGPALGILLSFVYFIFPLQFLNGRATVAVAAYRILLWLLLVLHLPLLLLAALDWMRQPDATALLVLTAPMSLLASIGLVPVARALRSLRWLDLAAPPQEWEPLAGDAVPGIDQPRGLPTPMLVALLLPFIATFRARQMALAALSLVLWCGGLAYLAVAPLRAVVSLVIAAAIGRHAAQAAPAAAAARRPVSLHSIFTAERLRPPPRWLAAGLLCLPLLAVLDYAAAAALWVARGTAGLPAFLDAVEPWIFALVVIIPLVLMPLMVLLPLGTRLAVLLYRIIGAIATAAAAGLAGFYSVNFMQQDARSLAMLPLTAGLLASLPLAVIVALSLPGAGRMTNMLTAGR